MNRKSIANNFFWDKGRDRALLWKVKRKDEQAFIKVYEKYIDDIFRFIYFKIGDQEEAQDVAAEVFLKTWSYIKEDKLKEVKSLKPFVYKVARNSVIDHYRKNKPGEIRLDDEDVFLDIEDENQNVVKSAEIKFEMKVVKEKLKDLKEEYREIIILRYINELSFSEIAEITGRSKNNIRVLTHRALKTLKEIIEAEKY